MEELLKNLKIGPTILTTRSNAVWDFLLAIDNEAKQLAGSILTKKAVRHQTEYMGTRKMRVILTGYPWGPSFLVMDKSGMYPLP